MANEYKFKNVVQYSKRLKLSHFQAIAAAKQPTKAMTMHLVPEFSHNTGSVKCALLHFFFMCRCGAAHLHQHSM